MENKKRIFEKGEWLAEFAQQEYNKGRHIMLIDDEGERGFIQHVDVCHYISIFACENDGPGFAKWKFESVGDVIKGLYPLNKGKLGVRVFNSKRELFSALTEII